MRSPIRRLAYVALPFGLAATMLGQQAPVGYDDTPMQPNGKWHIHDPDRPQPTVVTPGGSEGPVIPPPSDAIVLIGKGKDLAAWSMMDGTPSTWEIVDGIAATGRGMIRTRQDFADVQLHVEFQTPSRVEGDSQGRGNSGVYLMGAFEIQVL